MTKQQFMSELRSGLNFMSPEERNDIIQEFEEHFEVGVERGYSEQSLVDQLGDPKRIIEVYRNDAMEKGNIDSGDYEPPRDKPRAEPERHDKQPGGSGFANYVSIHERHDKSAINSISIECIDNNIKFSKSDDDYISIDIEGMSGCQMSCTVNGGQLSIRQEFRLWRFLNFRREPDINVKLPEIYGGALLVSSTAGDIKLDSFKGKSLKIKTVAADLKFGDIYADDFINISTTSGDIGAGKMMADEISISTTSGDMLFGNLVTKALSINGVSSDIVSERGSYLEAQTVDVTLVSGDVRLAFNDHWKGMTFSTVSGDVKLILPKESADFAVKFKSMSGDVKNHFTSTGEGSRSLKVKTMSGDLRIKQG